MGSDTRDRLVLTESDRGAIEAVLAHYRKYHPRRRYHYNGVQAAGVRRALRQGYTVRELCMAVDGLHLSAWHTGSNPDGARYDSLELAVKSHEQIDRFVSLARAHLRRQEAQQQREQAKRKLERAVANRAEGLEAFRRIVIGERRNLTPDERRMLEERYGLGTIPTDQ